MSLALDSVAKRYLPPPIWLRPVVRVAARQPVDALHDVTFAVAPGEVVGLLGPNGAGKTTLIKIVAGLLEPTAGTTRVDGVDVARDPLAARARLGLVLADERTSYWRLTGRQNLEYFGVLAGLPRHAAVRRAGELLERLDLAHRDKLVMGYSSGMRARLHLARALMAEPRLLVLDEPTRSLDPLAARDVLDLVRDLAATGIGVLLANHRLDEVASVCHRVVVLGGGRVRYDGRPEPAAGEEGLLRLLAAAAPEVGA